MFIQELYNRFERICVNIAENGKHHCHTERNTFILNMRKGDFYSCGINPHPFGNVYDVKNCFAAASQVSQSSSLF